MQMIYILQKENWEIEIFLSFFYHMLKINCKNYMKNFLLFLQIIIL